MSRRQTKTQSKAQKGKSPELTVQLPELCFNVYGHAFRHGIENRVENQHIVTYPLSSKPYAMRLTQLKGQNPRASMDLTEQEKGEAEPPLTVECVIVGLIPPKMDVRKIGKAIASAKGQVVGVQEPDEVLEEDDEALPLIVVAGVTADEPSVGIKLYALVDQRRGLCHPYIVAQKEVFYFNEFRDLTKATDARKTSWNDLVREQAIVNTDEATCTEKQLRYKRARDTTKLICEPSRSFANEVALLTSAFALHQDKWILDRLKEVLELSSEDLDDERFPTHSAIRAFVDKEMGELDESGAHKLIDEVTNLWPEVVKGVKSRDMIDLYKGICMADISLEFRLVRGFFALGIPAVKKRRTNKKLSKGIPTLGEIVALTKDRVALVIGNSDPPRASIMQDGAAAIIPALIKKLQEISTSAKASSKALQDLNGDQLVVDSLPDLFETFKSAVDTDTAKMAFHQGLRYAYGALAARTETVVQPIDNLVEVLEHLRLPKE